MICACSFAHSHSFPFCDIIISSVFVYKCEFTVLVVRLHGRPMHHFPGEAAKWKILGHGTTQCKVYLSVPLAFA